MLPDSIQQPKPAVLYTFIIITKKASLYVVRLYRESGCTSSVLLFFTLLPPKITVNAPPSHTAAHPDLSWTRPTMSARRNLGRQPHHCRMRGREKMGGGEGAPLPVTPSPPPIFSLFCPVRGAPFRETRSVERNLQRTPSCLRGRRHLHRTPDCYKKNTTFAPSNNRV